MNPAHPIDFRINADVFSTSEARAVFSEEARLQRWLDFEAALALAQGELEVIPGEAAAEIACKAHLEHIDLVATKEGYGDSRNSLMPLVNALRDACDGTFGEFVHYGVTTQDVLDTGQVLELKEVVRIVFRDLTHLETTLIELVRTHQDTPMVGRTHGQQASPITFGFKVAVWVAEIRRHIERLKLLTPRLLIGQLSGAVGTMAALGPKAFDVAEKTLARLGLNCSSITWHPARDSIAEFASLLAMMSASLEKIANEIVQLGKTEVGELREPASSNSAHSSTMPHKRNPVCAERICVLARHVRALSQVVIDGMVHEHERDGRALWSEWLAIPQISIYSCCALRYAGEILAGIEVDTERMEANLRLYPDHVLSEWVVFRFSEVLGRQHAQERVRSLLRSADEAGCSLAELISKDPELGPWLKPEDTDYLKHPGRHVGHAAAITARTLAEVLEQKSNDPAEFP